LIGPKLYEANWIDLTRAGHIANVQCVEVWCDMTPEFYGEYLKATSTNRKQLLYVMNPNKFRACQFLVRYHEQRGDKIIVFSDLVYALKMYATKMNKHFIYGPTSNDERMKIFQLFRQHKDVNVVFISKVGDNAIDLPEATVVIQISSHYGSRRQEAQRLGRILRPKGRTDPNEPNAFYYSLVSKDTDEMFYSTKRQQFLIDQGYSFKVISKLEDMADPASPLDYQSKEEQLKLLRTVLDVDETEGAEEMLKRDDDDVTAYTEARYSIKRKLSSTRVEGNMSSLSGVEDMAYMEIRSEERPNKKQAGHKHTLFRKRFEAKKK